jgi:hypothetical protein
VNSKERILAIAVGALAILIGGYFVQSRVSKWFDNGHKQIESLKSDLTKQRRLVAQSNKAAAQLAKFEAESLPTPPTVARSLYSGWLINEVQKAGLAEEQVKAISMRLQGDVYTQQTFSVAGKGTLAQIVNFLHRFYSVDLLHRVSKLNIKPLKDSKQLDFSMTVEALSLKVAPVSDKLTLRPSDRLKLSALDDYTASIVGRNLFGPPNHAPKLAVSSSLRGETNRPLDARLTATDPDALDRLTFTLLKSPVKEATVDATSGRLQWTPKTPGKYEFEIAVSDDGIPAKVDKRLVAVTVTDPPPPGPPPPPEPKKLAFDDAKFTVLTAVVDVDGDSEVWLAIRPRGQTLRLRKGEEFEIGSVKGVVAQIGLTDFVFTADGKSHRLYKGEILEQAHTIQ